MNALVDVVYDSEDKCIVLGLTDGKIKDEKFKPYFYCECDKDHIIKYLNDNLDLKENILNIETVEKYLLKKNSENGHNFKKTPISKITVKYPNNVPKLRVLKDLGEIYEHDIPFTKRYLIDNDIVPMTNYDDIRKKDRKIVDENIPKLKSIAFDMEVYCLGREPNHSDNPIIMTSFYSEDFKKVITYKNFNHPNVMVVKDEVELIKKTVEILKNYDIIYTYNGDNFDFPYLKRRAEHLGIKIYFDNEKKSKIVISRGGIHLRSYIPYKIHIDLYPISRRTLNLTKYTLEDVAYHLFNVEKLSVGHGNISKLWDNGDTTLVEYSFQDAKYTYKIGNYFLPLEVMFCRIVNQTLFEICRMSSSQMVEYLLLKHSFKNNYIAPNRPSNKEYQKRLRDYYEGGYVMEPVKGLHENIVSMDFRSLYPSIIISYNISPDTINCECCKDDSEKILEYWFCKKRIGLIPKVLRDLLSKRRNIKDRMKNISNIINNNRGNNINNINNFNKNNNSNKNNNHKNNNINSKNNNISNSSNNKNNTDINNLIEKYNLLNYEQQSLKILANSHYGYLAYPRARWYSKECAEITAYLGRKYIKMTIEECEKFGFKVLYADTDGLYATIPNSTKDEIIRKTNIFLKYINEKLPKDMELEYEGYYKRGLFISKKRYALIDENNKIIIKGLEFVRRDWSKIARDTQKRVIEALLIDGSIKKAESIIKNVISDLKGGKINKKDLIIYTQITKNLDEYKTTAPHVSVAKKILKKGEPLHIGDVIGYIIVSGNKSISERAELPENAKDYDINYYIENQILPPVLRIMESLGYTKAELKSSGKQSTLDSFW